ncbi:MAG: hypothetical protein CM1200mP10_25390 [Candidatus Neomarinimicrobiota bacterium]|nr:MAG: hypothetical protein CM1200mP10_25390 [Candidatus Neomarinimicrobiota bacterium]
MRNLLELSKLQGNLRTKYQNNAKKFPKTCFGWATAVCSRPNDKNHVIINGFIKRNIRGHTAMGKEIGMANAQMENAKKK